MWYVLYSKSKYEIKAAGSLKKMGMEVFCPTVKEIRQWSDRRKTVIKPLFNSYLFIKLEEKDREKVFEVTCIVRYVYWLGKPARVNDKEINIIKEWLENDNMEKIEVTGLKPGDNIKLTSGVFKDHEATIQEIGNNKMKLILKNLGCLVTVTIKDINLT